MSLELIFLITINNMDRYTTPTIRDKQIINHLASKLPFAPKPPGAPRLPGRGLGIDENGNVFVYTTTGNIEVSE